METQKKSGNNPAVIVIVLLLLAAGAFFFFQQKKGPALSPEMKVAQEAMMKDCTYDRDFCIYAANAVVAMSKGYTVTTESVYNGKKSHMVLKADGKDNTQSTTTVDGKEEGSFISLDKTTYMKAAGEKEWIEYPPMKEEGTTEKSGLFDMTKFKEEMTKVAKEKQESFSVKKVGTEKCGNLTCIVFEMTDTSVNSTTKLWVDTAEHLSRKMEIASKEGGKTTMTFDYGPVTITKPSPVKKMPSFDSQLKDSGINMEEIQKMMKDLPQTQQGAGAADEVPAETPAE